MIINIHVPQLFLLRTSPESFQYTSHVSISVGVHDDEVNAGMQEVANADDNSQQSLVIWSYLAEIGLWVKERNIQAFPPI